MLGELIAKLPVDVQLGKLIVFGHLFGVLDKAIIIAAGTSAFTEVKFITKITKYTKEEIKMIANIQQYIFELHILQD